MALLYQPQGGLEEGQQNQGPLLYPDKPEGEREREREGEEGEFRQLLLVKREEEEEGMRSFVCAH